MLEYKKISDDTCECMKKAVESDMDYYNLAVCSINELIPSEEIHVLNSANSCLITICKSIPEPVLVCDEGGWNGFIKSCEVFEKDVEYLTTDDGLINIEVLDNYLESHDIKSLYITSLSGYTATQPIKKIQELCNIHDVLLIIDVSGSVGDKRIKEGDIQVSSTGSPKIVNIENGGFICNITGKIKLNRHLLKSFKADNITCAGITNEIRKSTEILEKTMKANTYLKNKLKNSGVEVVHPKHRGLNTIIKAQSKSKAKKIAYNIRQELNMKNNIITVGPNYNRIKKASVIIEVKNLNIAKVTKEDLDYISESTLKSIEKVMNSDN